MLANLGNEWSISLFGKDFGILGYKGFFLSGSAYDVSVMTLFLFQMVFMDTEATIPTGVRPTPQLPPLERQLLVWLRAPAPGEALNAAVYADAMVGLLKRGLARLTGTLQACSLQLTPAGLATSASPAPWPAGASSTPPLLSLTLAPMA